MSGKLLWTGLTLVVGLPAILTALNVASAVTVFILVGGVLMLIGTTLLLLDK